MTLKIKKLKFSDCLSNIVDNRGRSCPTTSTGIPLIATNCIKNDSLFPVFENIRYLNQETYNNWFRAHPKPGDMIFVCKGSPGRVCWTPNPIKFCIAQDMLAIRANEKIVYPKYLFALLRSKEVQKSIENLHVGSLIPHFKKGDFDKLILPMPEDLEFQKKVGDIYFDFCLKIELNRQMNNTLEQMAQAMFKEYFLDYEKGTIQLSDYILLNPKISIPKNSIVKYVEMSDLPVSGSSIIHFIDRPFNSGSKFQINDTLLARITPCLENGKTGFVDFMQEKEAGFGSTEFIVMRSKKDISPYYVYFIARDNSFREHAIRSMVGTSGRQRVQTEMLNDYMLKEIDPEEMKKFHLFSESCFSKIKNNCNENKFLVQLRESLLPKLMSGEISTDSLPLIESREKIIA